MSNSSTPDVAKRQIEVKAHERGDGTRVKRHIRRLTGTTAQDPSRMERALTSFLDADKSSLKTAALFIGVPVGGLMVLRFGAPLIVANQRAVTWGGAARRGSGGEGFLNQFAGTARFGQVKEGFRVLEPSSYRHLQGADYATTLRNIEKAIKGLPQEHAFVLNRQGKIMSGFQGTQGNVAIATPMGMPAALRNRYVVTHNHPMNGPFSGADLAFQNLTKVGEMRAVLPNGSVSAMRLKHSDPITNYRSTKITVEQAGREGAWLQTNVVNKMTASEQSATMMGEFSHLARWFENPANLARYNSFMASSYNRNVTGRGGWTLTNTANVAKVFKAYDDGKIGPWIESEIHRHFTNIADGLYGRGKITRKERIALSSAIGDALDRYVKSVESKAPAVYELAKAKEEIAKHLIGRHNQADHARSDHKTGDDRLYDVPFSSDTLKEDLNAESTDEIEAVRIGDKDVIVRNTRTGAVAHYVHRGAKDTPILQKRTLGRAVWSLAKLLGDELSVTSLMNWGQDITARSSRVVGKHLLGRHEQKDHDPHKGARKESRYSEDHKDPKKRGKPAGEFYDRAAHGRRPKHSRDEHGGLFRSGPSSRKRESQWRASLGNAADTAIRRGGFKNENEMLKDYARWSRKKYGEVVGGSSEMNSYLRDRGFLSDSGPRASYEKDPNRDKHGRKIKKHLIGQHNQKDHDPTKGGHRRAQHSEMSRPLKEQAALSGLLAGLTAWQSAKPTFKGAGSGPVARTMYGLYALNFALSALSSADKARSIDEEFVEEQTGGQLATSPGPSATITKRDPEPGIVEHVLQELSEVSGARPDEILEALGGWMLRKKITKPTLKDLHKFMTSTYGG